MCECVSCAVVCVCECKCVCVCERVCARCKHCCNRRRKPKLANNLNLALLCFTSLCHTCTHTHAHTHAHTHTHTHTHTCTHTHTHAHTQTQPHTHTHTYTQCSQAQGQDSDSMSDNSEEGEIDLLRTQVRGFTPRRHGLLCTFVCGALITCLL